MSLLLNEGCPINVVDSGGRSVLHFAARYGQIHMIEMLGEKGLNVNIGDDEGMDSFTLMQLPVVNLNQCVHC